MSKYFSFAGMQRSGNHAIINWWLGHFPAYCFRNNILGLSYKEKAAQYENNNAHDNGGVSIDSWENYNPNDIETAVSSQPLIVILRDPWNWWASWFRYTIPNPNVHYIPRGKTIELYLDYVNYARTNPDHWISFNHWFSDPEYRRCFEHQYDMKICDDNLEQISDIGSGSTFNGMAFQGKAQQMQVLTRYKNVITSPAYYEPLRKYPELADISRKLFNMEAPQGVY